MAFTLVNTNTIIARNAGALYNTEVNASNMATYITQMTSLGVNAFLNAVYVASVPQTDSNAVVAANLLTVSASLLQQQRLMTPV